MKVHSRRSEYQNCFATPSPDYFRTIYEEQLAYRIKRREKEHCHYVMQWDSESMDEVSDASFSKDQENE